ncbi:MAG: trypsin-like peptidase domain-containing protein [Gemmatimonadetes bacterium]|jgi:serine protease Do|nr:trypsin-like peptidase domain-containing protein [Gemmatimonadota bacterium]
MYDPLRAKAKVVFYSALAFVFGIGMASGLGWTSPSYAMPVINELPQVSAEAVQPALDLSAAFTNLADAVTPAVVRIESRRPVTTARERVPEALRQFYDLPQGRDLPPSQGEIAGGSGFIVSPDGYIMTNNHVVEGADQVTVYFADRRVFDAVIVGSDPFTDVAIIKIDAGESLAHMSIGNSDETKVGEWILAVGNPGFGRSAQLDFTVTAGIISARGRGLRLLQNDLANDPRYGPAAAGFAIEDFIQTDAVINPGNSGGPMVNLKGQVVGINSAIASTTGAYQGYGFAIPINLARRVMEDLVAYGHVKRPRIGVGIEDANPEDAEVYGLPSVSGILVQTVEVDGPSSGRLRIEDVIVGLDGEAVGYVAELQAKIAQHRPGDRVNLTVYRDRRPVDVEIRLDAAPINEIPTVVAESTVHSEDRLGIKVETLDADLAMEANWEAPGGVILTDVSRGSAADRRQAAGYLGQKLVQVQETRITTPEDVREALDGVEGGAVVSLHFEDRQGDVRVVNVRMPR